MTSDTTNHEKIETLYRKIMGLSSKERSCEAVAYYNAAQMLKESLMTPENQQRINLEEHKEVLRLIQENTPK